ncbi:MAG TPA: META domain-containing protein [Anaerolineae bacterium]
MLLLLMAAAACMVAPDQPADPLAGTSWVLAGFGAPESLQPPVPGTEITAEFEGGQVGGTSDCNSYGGTYRVSGNSFEVDEVASTAMLCAGEPIMQQEKRYQEALTAADSFTLEDELLIIHSANGDLVFTPAVPLPLEGTRWQLQGVAQDGALVSTWVDVEITATFVDGRVTGSAGCNDYVASYEIDGESPSIGDVSITDMACDQERDQREAEFLGALAEVAGYETDGTTLTLTDAEGEPLLIFQQQSTSLPPELYGVVWQLVALETPGGPLPAPRGTTTTAQFVDDVVAGNGGCNPYTAGYHLAAEAFVLFIGNLSHANDYCDDVVNQQERLYFQMLEAAESFTLENDTLIIYTTDGTLSFTRAPFTTYKPAFVALADGTRCSLTSRDDPVVDGGKRRSYFCFQSGAEMTVLIGELEPGEESWTAEKAILVGTDEDFTVRDVSLIEVGLPQPHGNP